MSRYRKLKLSPADQVFKGFAYATMILFALIIILPLINLVAISLSGREAVVGGTVTFVPRDITAYAYIRVLTSSVFYRALKNSVLITVGGTIVGLVFSISAGYPLSKPRFPFRKVGILLFVFAMLFDVGIIPMYLVIRNLGLINTHWAIVFTGAINVFFMLIIKNYFETLPDSLEESAKIDGASYYTILVRIILPISKPVLATVTLFYAVLYWNNYFQARLYLNSQRLMPIQVYLRSVIFEAMDPAGDFALDAENVTRVDAQSVINATLTVCMLPIICLYPFLQRYFVKGVVLGSVKG